MTSFPSRVRRDELWKKIREHLGLSYRYADEEISQNIDASVSRGGSAFRRP
jgi:hypothetical protein